MERAFEDALSVEVAARAAVQTGRASKHGFLETTGFEVLEGQGGLTNAGSKNRAREVSRSENLSPESALRDFRSRTPRLAERRSLQGQERPVRRHTGLAQSRLYGGTCQKSRRLDRGATCSLKGTLPTRKLHPAEEAKGCLRNSSTGSAHRSFDEMAKEGGGGGPRPTTRVTPKEQVGPRLRSKVESYR